MNLYQLLGMSDEERDRLGSEEICKILKRYDRSNMKEFWKKINREWKEEKIKDLKTVSGRLILDPGQLN